jgi:hypothetical protein
MRKYFLLLCFMVMSAYLLAHPMPASVVKLSVMDKSIKGEAKMPLLELESAIKQPLKNINTLFFRRYFRQHIRAVSGGNSWLTTIGTLWVTDAQDSTVGKYQQVIVTFEMVPPVGADLRKFTFDYDVIMHEVITHKALVLLDQDWANGIHGETSAQVVGMIKLDVPTGKIYPLEVSLTKGSYWKGFTSMLQLGMQHIRDGTDHLLFLIVLLLPAVLTAQPKRWGSYGGFRYSLKNLLKIVTAFTIGHSITLLLGALGWLSMPGQPVEILIACSILVSAIHAIRPVFPGREVWIAAGFGLIHGMAFASVLANLDLSVRTLALSILGFNLGIELMQLLIILMIVPWLMLLCQTAVYAWFRVTTAAFAGIAALGWIIERVSGNGNFITVILDKLTPYSVWLILVLAVTSCMIYFKTKYFTATPTATEQKLYLIK